MANFYPPGHNENKKTIALDFDGVIHDAYKGWGDGTCYGEPLPGALEAIKSLSQKYNIVIFTAKARIDRPLVNGKPGTLLVLKWLEKYGVDNIAKLEEIKKKQSEIKQNQEEIDKLTKQHESISKNIEDLRNTISDQVTISEKNKKLVQLEAKLENNKTKIQSDISFYESNDHCPTCKHELEEKFKTDKYPMVFIDLGPRVVAIVSETSLATNETLRTFDTIPELIGIIDRKSTRLNSSHT